MNKSVNDSKVTIKKENIKKIKNASIISLLSLAVITNFYLDSKKMEKIHAELDNISNSIEAVVYENSNKLDKQDVLFKELDCAYNCDKISSLSKFFE